MDIKDGSNFDLVRGGVTFNVQAYVDLEGDPPWPLVVEVRVGDEFTDTPWSEEIEDAQEREDWSRYVDLMIDGHLRRRRVHPDG